MRPVPNLKAIFFDIDGTLLSGKTGRIPQSAVDALLAAHQKGYRLFLSTGRHPAEIDQVPELAALPFSGVVSMNGQYCYCGDEVIHSETLPAADVAVLADYLQTAPYAALYSRANQLYITKFTPVVQAVCESVGTKPAPVGSLRDMLAAPIYQAGLFLGGDAVPEVLERMPGCYWTSWHTLGVDISPVAGGKWTGVEKMARHFGIHPAQVMTVGDNENDIDMLEHAGYSVAMGNGTKSAKSAAHHVTAAVDDHGIALALADLPKAAQA